MKHAMEHVSVACVHLAFRKEETPRQDVISTFHFHLREKKPVPLLWDQDYVNLKEQIINVR